MFTLKLKITKADGGNTTDKLMVAPINNFGYSIFRWIEAEINTKKLTDIPDKAIGYLMYLLTVLNYDTVDQTTFLPFRGWYRDTDKEFDTKAAGNVGFALRH